MAGTEETTKTEQDLETSADRAHARGDEHDGRRRYDGPIDASVHDLAIRGLRGRLHTTRTWKAQGNVEGEPLLIVRQACLDWLAETEAEAEALLEELENAPVEPQKDPCADCGGVERHTPDCVQLLR
jgi:hypothetical protein